MGTNATSKQYIPGGIGLSDQGYNLNRVSSKRFLPLLSVTAKWTRDCLFLSPNQTVGQQGYPTLISVENNATNPLPQTMSGHPNTESLQCPRQCVLEAEKPDAQLGHPAVPGTLPRAASLQSNAIGSKDHVMQGGIFALHFLKLSFLPFYPRVTQ